MFIISKRKARELLFLLLERPFTIIGRESDPNRNSVWSSKLVSRQVNVGINITAVNEYNNIILQDSKHRIY